MSSTVSQFYIVHPPHLSVFFNNHCTTLQNLSPHQFALLGDFNINFCNTYCCKLNGILQMLSLSQIVYTPTHTSPNGCTSLIDLALVSNTALLLHCSSVPPLLNSDHNMDLNFHLNGDIMTNKYSNNQE